MIKLLVDWFKKWLKVSFCEHCWHNDDSWETHTEKRSKCKIRKEKIIKYTSHWSEQCCKCKGYREFSFPGRLGDLGE